MLTNDRPSVCHNDEKTISHARAIEKLWLPRGTSYEVRMAKKRVLGNQAKADAKRNGVGLQSIF